MESSDTLKVGELARRTGLTVRTLHHYDEIGLLSPSRRTSSGHRLYGVSEVRRLQRIVSLRQLGLSLEEIRLCLDRPEYGLEQVLDMQIRRLQDEMSRRRELLERIERLRDRVHGHPGDVSLEDLTEGVQATVDYRKYYTPEQLDALARRGREMGSEGLRQAQVEWTRLFAAFEAAMEQGLDPASEEVRALSRKAAALVEGFTGGDPGIGASLARMFREEGGQDILARQGASFKPGLWDYYMKAMEARGPEPTTSAARGAAE